jgi:hypothetical protein
MTNDEYDLWLLDTARDKHRILLLEMSHPPIPIYHPSISSEYPAGTIYLASHAFLDHSGQAYDDWLLSLPTMETNLDNFGGIGGFRAKNNDDTVRWEDISWYGQECRWLFGDTSWSRSWFKTIETAAIKQCIPEGGGIYEFELIDGGLTLDKTLVSTSTTRTETVQSFVDWVAGELGVPITFINVSAAKLALTIEVTMYSFSLAGNLLRAVTKDINAKLRRNLSGGVEIFVPSNTVIEISKDSITSDKLAAFEVVLPFSSVEITMPDDVVVSAATTANTGTLERIRKVDTYLNVVADVNALLAELILECVQPCHIYEVPIVLFDGTLTVGDKIHTDHPDLVRNGLITRVVKVPLSSATILEVQA